jgi:diguanylate cyclase (GGDEF)-like protein
VVTVPLAIFDKFTDSFLSPAISSFGGDAFLVDRAERVVGTSNEKSFGRHLPPGLPDALAAKRSGTYDSGDVRFVAIPVSGTSLRIVLTADEDRLLSPLHDTSWTNWGLYGLLALVLIGGTAIFLRRRTRELEEERRRGESRLRLARTHDAVTGLPTRGVVSDRLTLVLREVGGGNAAVIVLDIDRFKRINDSFGHETGDQVLAQLAQQVGAELQPGDVLGRIGGDHFTIVREQVSGLGEALRLVSRIQRAAERPVRAGGSDISLSVRAGVSMGGVSQDAETLLRQADTALAEAKENGSPVEIFGESMEGRVKRKVELEAALGEAIRRGELVLHYQPIVTSRRGVVGFEALVRWQHPMEGLLSPAEFIPLAEETDLILKVGDWVLGAACSQAASWRRAGHDLQISVNISARDLADSTLPDRVRTALDAAELSPNALIVEITESNLAGPQAASWMMGELRKLGVQTAVDDFGVGYSSWSRLARLPIDVLKIDRSFVGAMDDPRYSALLTSMVRLGGSLGLVVVAEGVETKEEADLLSEMGCHLQGFHFSHPLPAGEAGRLLDGSPGLTGATLTG